MMPVDSVQLNSQWQSDVLGQFLMISLFEPMSSIKVSGDTFERSTLLTVMKNTPPVPLLLPLGRLPEALPPKLVAVPVPFEPEDADPALPGHPLVDKAKPISPVTSTAERIRTNIKLLRRNPKPTTFLYRTL